MNRKGALKRLLWLSGSGALIVSGFKGYHLLKSPDLSNLSQEQSLIDELAETIIPKTDTPGAKEAGVGIFITRMVMDCASRLSQVKFIDGLDDLKNYAEVKYQKPYVNCSETEKREILSHFEKKGSPYKGISGKIEHKFLGDSFFVTLKKYTILGFCTSQKGATIALNYDPVPGKYQTIPAGAQTKAWAVQ